jgi:hypothetical protein
MEEEFTPPLEASLRRADSNRSWKPPSQDSTQTVESEPVDKQKLFLVSLRTLVALFSTA